MARLGFGKHLGQEMRDVPLSYLHWIAENTDVFQKARFSHEEQKEFFELIGPRATDNAEIKWLRDKLKPTERLEKAIQDLQQENVEIRERCEALQKSYNEALRKLHQSDALRNTFNLKEMPEPMVILSTCVGKVR